MLLIVLGLYSQKSARESLSAVVRRISRDEGVGIECGKAGAVCV